jgi:hypothetical protein
MASVHMPPEPAMDKTNLSDACSTLALDSDLPSGLPGDRTARIAARRAFVEMKHLFMRAVADLGDRKGQWLREKVRLSSDPMDLWLLRSPVLAALHRNDAPTRKLRAELYRGLDSIFPEAFGLGTGAGASTLPPQHWDLGGEAPQATAIWR